MSLILACLNFLILLEFLWRLSKPKLVSSPLIDDRFSFFF